MTTQATSLQLSDFKAKAVQGLYSFNHFEHPCGAFIQVHVRGDLYVYRDVEGNMSDYPTLDALKAAHFA